MPTTQCLPFLTFASSGKHKDESGKLFERKTGRTGSYNFCKEDVNQHGWKCRVKYFPSLSSHAIICSQGQIISCSSYQVQQGALEMSTRYSYCWSVVWTLAWVCPSSKTCHYPKFCRFARWLWCAGGVNISSLCMASTRHSLNFPCMSNQSSMISFKGENSWMPNKPELACSRGLLVTLLILGRGKAWRAKVDVSIPLM